MIKYEIDEAWVQISRCLDVKFIINNTIYIFTFSENNTLMYHSMFYALEGSYTKHIETNRGNLRIPNNSMVR